MSDVINRIKTSPIKIPIVLFLCPIILVLLFLLENFCAVFFWREFFYTIHNGYHLFETLARISFFAIGIYLGVLYFKEKNIYYAVAAVAFVIKSFMHIYTGWFYWGRQLLWLVCGISLAMPAIQDMELQGIGKAAVGFAVAYPVFSGIANLINMNSYTSMWYWIFLIATNIAVCLELVCLMVLLLEYSRKFESMQGLFATATAGVSAVKTQVADLSSSAKEQASSISSKFTGTDTDVPSTGADAGNTIADIVSGVGTSNLGSTPVRTTPSGGRQYKTVAGPVGLAISNKDSYSVGVNQYAAIIDREAVGGWQLDSIYKIPVTKSAGCLGSLFGKQDETVSFNMLIFYKDE